MPLCNVSVGNQGSPEKRKHESVTLGEHPAARGHAECLRQVSLEALQYLRLVSCSLLACHPFHRSFKASLREGVW